ncbi:hypothetical protein GGQ58_005136 [Paracoccus denitrificans]|nr:hypothetical protein [Paracoccus denitrificans]
MMEELVNITLLTRDLSGFPCLSSALTHRR